MAKKTISRLSVLAVLIVFLAACSKTSEYTNVIPADASVVASINLKSLASKAGLDDKENEAAKQKVLEALRVVKSLCPDVLKSPPEKVKHLSSA